jgi:hypothetical protein
MYDVTGTYSMRRPLQTPCLSAVPNMPVMVASREAGNQGFEHVPVLGSFLVILLPRMFSESFVLVENSTHHNSTYYNQCPSHTITHIHQHALRDISTTLDIHPSQ